MVYRELRGKADARALLTVPQIAAFRKETLGGTLTKCWKERKRSCSDHDCRRCRTSPCISANPRLRKRKRDTKTFHIISLSTRKKKRISVKVARKTHKGMLTFSRSPLTVNTHEQRYESLELKKRARYFPFSFNFIYLLPNSKRDEEGWV